MFNLTYEFKLKPTLAEVTIFEDWLEQCRRVYNWALAEVKIGLNLVVVKLTLAHFALNI